MINKLVKGIKKKEAPVVVGLDPKLSYVPKHIRMDAYAAYGETLEGAAEAIWRFNKGIIDAVEDLVPAVKPQIAMYEMLGLPGLRVFDRTCVYARSKGLVVIGDIKRGDIGSTSEAYATGHLGEKSVGVIGIAGFPVYYESMFYDFEDGDELILFSDGVVDIKNEKDEYFGKDHLLEAVKLNIGKTAAEQVSFIANSIYSFCGKREQNDDLTIIVLKK